MSLLPEISQASAEINKFVAQANIHQTIAPVNPAEFTSPADTALLASRDPVIREVSVGMTGEGYSDYSVSGTPPLSLPNSLGKPLKAWEVCLEPYQDLHGYDSPWPAGGGKNKFFHGTELRGKFIQQIGTVSSADGWMVSDYIPVLPNTQYTFNPNSNGGNSAYAAFYNVNKLKKGTTIPSGKQTFTTYEDTAYMRFSFRATSEDIQLELGSTDTEFAPYSNLCPIIGTDKVNLYVEESYDPTATPKAVITIPSTIYSGSVYDGGAGSNWGEVDLGTLNWSAYSSGVNTYRAQVSGKAFGDSNVLTDIYATRVTAFSNMDNCTIRGESSNTYIYVRDDAYTDVNSFKQAVTGHKLIYELATPTTFAVPSVTIPTPTGTATAWATAEDGTVDSMEVTYYKSE